MTEIIDVESQFPGVFFRQSGPDQPPFVEIGDHVIPGQTLGVVEIMKQFAPVESEVAGTVVEVCIRDRDTVDAGTVVFKIQLAS